MLRLLITSFRVWLQAKTRKLHKSFKVLPCSCYTKIRYSSARLVLYFAYSTRANALTYTYTLLLELNGLLSWVQKDKQIYMQP